MSPLEFIPGGSLTAIAAAVVAALLGVWRVYAAGRKSGRYEQQAKEAEHRARNLDHIKSAANARPRGGVHDDPNNRDNR